MKKRILTIMITIAMAMTVVGCAGKDTGNAGSSTGSTTSSSNQESSNEKSVSTASIAEEIKNQIEMRKTALVEGEMLTEKFHLNMDDIEEQTIENGIMNSGLETIVVVKAKSGKAEDVKASLEKVIEDKKASAFYPGEPEAVESAQLKVVGDYVGLFIVPDYDETGENYSEKAAEIFEKALK